MFRLLLTLFLAAPTYAADPPKPDLRLPVLRATTSPAPPAGSAWDLSAGKTYAFDSDSAYLLRAVPEGLVTIAKTEGPLAVSAVFVDGPGTRERRKFDGKYVVEVEPVPTKKGRVTLVLVKTGAAVDADVVLVPIDVNGGEGAQPPPLPPVINDKPVPVIIGKAWGWVLVEETAKGFPNRGPILAAAVPWTESKNVKHRVIDKDVLDANGKIPADAIPYLVSVGAIVRNADGTYTKQAPTKPLPHLFIVTDQGGVYWEGDAPTAGPAAFTGKLGEYIK